jgi:hypothetical protein
MATTNEARKLGVWNLVRIYTINIRTLYVLHIVYKSVIENLVKVNFQAMFDKFYMDEIFIYLKSEFLEKDDNDDDNNNLKHI